MLGVDVSGSVRHERMDDELQFIADLVDGLEVSPVKTRVALVYFSDHAYQLFGWTQFEHKQDVIHAVKTTPYLGGRTHSAAALGLMVNQTRTYGLRPSMFALGSVLQNARFTLFVGFQKTGFPFFFQLTCQTVRQTR